MELLPLTMRLQLHVSNSAKSMKFLLTSRRVVEEFDQLFVGRKRGMKNRGVQTDAQRFMVESTAKQRLRAELEKKSRPQGGPTFEYKMLNKGLNSNKREQAAEEREEAAREALEMGPDKNIRVSSSFVISLRDLMLLYSSLTYN